MKWLLRQMRSCVRSRGFLGGRRPLHATSSRATSILACAILIIFAASSACRSTSSNLWTQRIEYRDRLSFSWNFSPNNGSMQIKNLGPGSVTVELELRDGRTTKQDLDEGASNYYMLQNLTRVELLHNTATTAAAEWSILEDLRNGVSVRAQ